VPVHRRTPWIPWWWWPTAALLLVGMGVVLYLLRPEDGTEQVDGGPTSAASTTDPQSSATPPRAVRPVDLVDLAPDAVWTDQLGEAVAFSEQTTAVPQPGVGHESSTSGDGSRVLVVKPSAVGTITGSWAVPLREGDHLRGRVWRNESGLLLRVTAGEVLIHVQLGPPDGTSRRPLDIDLTEAVRAAAASGTEITELELTVESTGLEAAPQVRWLGLRVDGG
jgi:hypothetical protein